MNTTQYILGAIGDLAAWVLGGVILFGLLRLILFLIDVLPLTARTKASIVRFAPIVELIILVAYAASALVELYAEERLFFWALVGLIAVMGAFFWSALYDLAIGVAFRVARVCQVGDLLQVGDIEGRVLEVGVRALVLQTRDGDEAVVPYGRIGRGTLRRTQSVSGAYVHSFVLDHATSEDFAELKRRVVRAAMGCHWASAVHEAKVERRAGGKVEVSVFAHDADHAPQVESAVRRALDGEVPMSVAIPDTHELSVMTGTPPEELPSQSDDADPFDEAPATPSAATKKKLAIPKLPAPAPKDDEAAKDDGVPKTTVGDDPSEAMDLRTVLGPVIPPPPSKWKK